MTEGDGWTLVRRGRRRQKRRQGGADGAPRRRGAPSARHDDGRGGDDDDGELEALQARLRASSSALHNHSRWLEHVGELVRSCSPQVRAIYALGVGSFCRSEAARLQLVVLLELRRATGAPPVQLFEPAMRGVDLSLCAALGANASTRFNDGEFAILSRGGDGSGSQPGVVVYFMPHCPRTLYSNLLRANWSRGALCRLVLVGNSFSSYALRLMRKEKTSFVERAAPFVREQPLPELSKHATPDVVWAFNDLAVHTFAAEALPAADDELWRWNCAPQALWDDQEFIQQEAP